MATGAPTDSTFYLRLADLFSGFGKPEDFLWIWSSETGLDPTLSGNSRTISTLMHDGVVPSLLTQAEWDSLPQLSAADQLPFIQRYYQQIHDKYLFRKFQDTFEVYLANAAPGLIRPDGKYNAATVMYGSPQTPANAVWAANWPMDNYPRALQEAQSRGVKLSIDFGKQLVSEGLLKGWISLGDLRAFGMRQANAAIANDAITKYHDNLLQAKNQGNTTVPATYLATVPNSYVPAGAPGGYAPDFSKSFSDPTAPVDTRVAASPSPISLLSWREALVLGVGVWVYWKWFLK